MPLEGNAFTTGYYCVLKGNRLGVIETRELSGHIAGHVCTGVVRCTAVLH